MRRMDARCPWAEWGFLTGDENKVGQAKAGREEGRPQEHLAQRNVLLREG